MKVFRKVLAMLLVLASVLSLGVGAFAAGEWEDVPGGIWYEDYVISMVDAGLMNGISDGVFAPMQTLNRAMFVTILNRAVGKPDVVGNASYTDVVPGAWYEKAVMWAASQSVVTGYTDGRFGVGDPLTREQMVTILYRYVSGNQQVEAPANALDSFSDKASVSSYAVDAFRWAVSEGIISGKGAGLLDPKGTSTRAEAAAVITRFLNFAATKYDRLTREDLERAVAEVAFAYYLKNEAFQYDSEDKSEVFGRYYGGTYRLTEGATPEDGTTDSSIYSVCSDYVFKTYLNALGYRMYGAPSYSDAVTTAIWLFSEREGMLLKRWKNDNYSLTSDDVKYGVTEASFCSLEELQDFVRNWEENLRPGDVFLPTGHAMLYVGNGYVLDCAGSKYDMKLGIDKIETGGAIKHLHKIDELFFTTTGPLGNFTTLSEDLTKDYFCVVRPLNALVESDNDNNPANDRVKNDLFSIPASTLSRLAYPGMEINRTVDITPYGTAYTGQTLTYNVAVSNKSTDDFYKTYQQYEDPNYAGVDYTNLTVTEKIPAGTTLVAGSISEGGTVKNGVITWNVNVAAGGVKNLTYKVTVTARQGQQIVSTGGMVANIPSNTIVNAVGGRKLSDSAIQGLTQFAADGQDSWREKYNVSALSDGTEFAERVYAKAMGIDLQLPTIDEFIENVMERKTMLNGPTSIRYSGVRSGKPLMLRENVAPAYQAYSDMIVGNMVGGRKMHFMNNEDTANEFNVDYMEVGDILVMADLTDDFKVESSMVLVMLPGAQAAIVTSENKMTLGRSIDALFASCMSKDVFFLLRPSQALADVNANAYTGPEPVYGEEPTEEAKEAAPLSEEAIARFAALQTNDTWSGKNTVFAEDVYALAGLDLKSVLHSSTVVTILKNVFSVHGGNASTSKYAYDVLPETLVAEAYRSVSSMLLDEFRGGPDMINNGFLREPKAADLQVGDVLYLVKREGSYYWVGVHLGNDKMIMCEYKSGNDPVYKLYDLSDEASFSALLRQSADGTTWECYFVLRPYLGFKNINTGTLHEST